MIKEILDNMSAKLGESNDLIVDDIARLIQYENENNETITNKDKEIAELTKRNETLTTVNANLLKSVPVITEKEVTPPAVEPEISISWNDCFDEKGNFKR